MLIKRLHKGYKNPAFFTIKLLVKVKVMNKVIKNEWLGVVDHQSQPINPSKNNLISKMSPEAIVLLKNKGLL
jgi:hypothetical protein